MDKFNALTNEHLKKESSEIGNLKKEKAKQTVQILFLLILIALFLAVFSPFLMPVVMGAIFACGLHPILERLGNRFRVKFKINAWIYLANLFIFILVPLLLFIYLSLQSLGRLKENGLSNNEFYQNLVIFKDHAVLWATGFLTRLNINVDVDFQQLGSDLGTKLSNFILDLSSRFLSQFPEFVMSFLIFLLTLYFFMKEKRQIKNYFFRSGLLSLDHSKEIVTIFQDACSGILIASALVGIIQASILALSALIFNAGNFWLVFIFAFFSSFLPAIGTTPVCIALAIPFLVKGQYGPMVGLLITGLIAGVSDNIIRPLLVSSGDAIHPFVAFLATVGGVVVFGLPGLFIGPVVAVITLKILPILIHNLTSSHPTK